MDLTDEEIGGQSEKRRARQVQCRSRIEEKTNRSPDLSGGENVGFRKRGIERERGEEERVKTELGRERRGEWAKNLRLW